MPACEMVRISWRAVASTLLLSAVRRFFEARASTSSAATSSSSESASRPMAARPFGSPAEALPVGSPAGALPAAAEDRSSASPAVSSAAGRSPDRVFSTPSTNSFTTRCASPRLPSPTSLVSQSAEACSGARVTLALRQQGGALARVCHLESRNVFASLPCHSNPQTWTAWACTNPSQQGSAMRLSRKLRVDARCSGDCLPGCLPPFSALI